jgi:hypothetical protein
MKMGTTRKTVAPSHGRGRRFNPCSAHHFSTTCAHGRAPSRRTAHERAPPTRRQLVENVRGAFLLARGAAVSASPYLIPGPCLVSFSGGRTSAYDVECGLLCQPVS